MEQNLHQFIYLLIKFTKPWVLPSDPHVELEFLQKCSIDVNAWFKHVLNLPVPLLLSGCVWRPPTSSNLSPTNTHTLPINTHMVPSTYTQSPTSPCPYPQMWAPEWCSDLRHCISVQEASLQSLVQIQAVSHPAVIGSPIEWCTIGPALSGFGRCRQSL